MTEIPASETDEQPSPAERTLEESTQRYRSLFTYHPHATFSRLETVSALGSGSTFTFAVPLGAPGQLPA